MSAAGERSERPPWWRRWWPRRRAPLPPVEAYRRWAATYGDDPNALQQLEASTLEAVLPPLDDRRVLDVGCGKGRAAACAIDAGARLALASDRTLAMLVSPRRNRRDHLHRLAAGTHPLPFADGTFDVVLCALVLGHVATLDDALDSLTRVVAEDGDLVITDFHPDATRRGWQRTFTDSHGRTRVIEQHYHPLDAYRKRLDQLGFHIATLEEATWQDHPVVFGLRAQRRG